MPDALPDLPFPTEGFIATHFVVAADIEVTARFYSEVVGGTVEWRGRHPGAPTYVKLANIWVCINSGGGPTPDKPEILLQTRAARAPFDTFLNLRVADVWALYREWSSKGARFLTPPIDNDGYEIRCYVMDPDARIIELGQPTGYVKEVADITGTASVE